MLKIDDNLLQTIGLGSLPTEDKRGLLTHIYETLEMRVGMRLADQMTNEQLDEFETYFEAKDDAGAFKWLETNFPNYKDIVNEEFEKLKGEVQQSAPQILAAAQANPAAQQAPQPADPQMPAGQPAQAMPPAQADWSQPSAAPAADTYSQPAQMPQPTQPVQPMPSAPAYQQPFQAPAANPVDPSPQAWTMPPAQTPWQPDTATANPAPAIPQDSNPQPTPGAQPWQPPAAPAAAQPDLSVPLTPTDQPAPTDASTQPVAGQAYQPMPQAWTPEQPQQGN